MPEGLVSYTSKDYASILQDMLNAIPNLTDKWKNFAEDDPGVVLIKLMAFLGDMLCYNTDYQVRETFPQTATQRKHAASMYSLIGYKMHWFQSAMCEVSVKFTRPDPTATGIPSNTSLIFTVPNFTQIVSADLTPYVIIGSSNDRTLVLPILADGQQLIDNNITADMLAVQGVLYVQNNIYPSNITSDGRIYFSNTTVDEDTENNTQRPHMMLTLCDGTTNVEIENWVKVSNLLNTREEGKYFEFKVDDNDAPYIQLCENYRNYLPLTDTKYFKLRYIISDGADGNVGQDVNFSFQNIMTIPYENLNVDITNYITITGNTQSDSGSNPETVEEARIGASREAQVLNTAVTLFDYETLVKSVDNVRACLALDVTSAGQTADSQNITKASCYDALTGYINYQLISNQNAILSMIAPGTLTIKLNRVVGETTTTLHTFNENGSNVFTDDNNDPVPGSFVLYNNGTIMLKVSGVAGIANVTNVKFEYNTQLPQYAVKLNVVVNDYQYIPDYTRTSISSLLDNRKVLNTQYYIREAELTCIPYNIVIHSTEPYTSSASLLPYIKEVVQETLVDFYDSETRQFGERINYAQVVNLIQDKDTKISVADVLYPERSLKLGALNYPMLGLTAISLSDDPHTAFLQDAVFSDANLPTLINTLIGDAGYSVVIAANTDKDTITGSLDLQTTVYLNETTGAVDLGGSSHTVEWWCSRSDLIITQGINIGNIISENLSADTPVTLFCKVYSGSSSMVIPVSINLTLRV